MIRRSANVRFGAGEKQVNLMQQAVPTGIFQVRTALGGILRVVRMVAFSSFRQSVPGKKTGITTLRQKQTQPADCTVSDFSVSSGKPVITPGGKQRSTQGIIDLEFSTGEILPVRPAVNVSLYDSECL